MKSIYNYISLAASGLSLVMAIILLIVGNVNQGLQNEIQKQQATYQAQQQEIEKGVQMSQNIGPAILRDMASVSVKNDKVKSILSKYGYTVTAASPTPAEKSAPRPASTPAESGLHP